MKKLLMSLAIFGACALMSATAADSYLYWMVDTSNSGLSETYKTFSTAVLKYSNGNAEIDYAFAPEGGGTSTAVSMATIADAGNYSFWVELYADDGWYKAKSNEISASALVGLYQSLQTGGTPANAQVFTNFTAQAIPEPTSGMMVLLGAMLLGLKRKKA